MSETQIEPMEKKSKPCKGGPCPMSEKEVKVMLERVEGWERKGNKIQKVY